MLLNITHKTSCNHLMQASQRSLGDAIVLTYRGWNNQILWNGFFFFFFFLARCQPLAWSHSRDELGRPPLVVTFTHLLNLLICFVFGFFVWEKWGGGFGGPRCGSGGPPCWRLLTGGLRKDEKRMQKVVQDLSQVCISHHTHALLTNEPVLSSTSPLKCST